MNKKQQTFVNEMLRHGDKDKAYRVAYPDAKSDAAIESSTNRLLKNPEVKQAIEEPRQRMRAELEVELKEQMRGELLDFYECQKTLAQIVRGQYTTTKQVRVKDGFETVEVKPTVSNVLTALNTFFLLNNHYPQKKTAAQLKAEELEHKAATAKKWEPDPELKRIMEKAAANPYRHPWGDIYPPEYRGPWYDPNDPNTRDQFLAITEPYRLSKLAKENSQHASPADLRENTTENNKSFSVTSLRETLAQQSDAAISRQHKQALIPRDCFVAEPPRNDVNLEKAQQNTTENNNSQQHKVPPSGGGGGDLTLEQQIAIKYKHVSDKVKKTLLRDELRKEGWQTIEEAFNEAYFLYLKHQHSKAREMMKRFEKARDNRNLPPQQRQQIETETGWKFHPQYAGFMRKTRPLL